MSAAAVVAGADADAQCRNCGNQLGPMPAKFCPHCGQTTHIHVPTVGEFVHEFLNHYVAVEGKLWRTLWTLIARPGVLTREYLQGRRERYVLPLRLFLTFSIVFFIAFKIIQPSLGTVSVTASQATVNAGQQASGTKASDAQASSTQATLTVAERREAAFRNVAKNGPYVAFFLLPFFTLLLRGFYSRRGLNFGSHLIFSFHFHTVAFALFFIGLLAPYRPVSLALFAIALLYLTIALNQTYGGRWWVNGVRALLMIFLQSCCVFVAVSIVAQIPAA